MSTRKTLYWPYLLLAAELASAEAQESTPPSNVKLHVWIELEMKKSSQLPYVTVVIIFKFRELSGHQILHLSVWRQLGNARAKPEPKNPTASCTQRATWLTHAYDETCLRILKVRAARQRAAEKKLRAFLSLFFISTCSQVKYLYQLFKVQFVPFFRILNLSFGRPFCKMCNS